MPFLADIVSFDAGGLIVDAVNQPADKVIFACRMFNAMQYNVRTVSLAMEASLPPDIKTLALVNLFTVHWLYKDEGWGEPSYYVVPITKTECYVFDFSTFGRASLKQFINADKDFAPWWQQSIQEQHGYYRDYDMTSHLFEAFENINFSFPLKKVGGFIHSTYIYKSLNRLFSVVPDEEPLLEECVKYYHSYGKYCGFAVEASCFLQEPKQVFRTEVSCMKALYADLYRD